MSTSSGRTGAPCYWCGHHPNEHVKHKFSKCKKCRKIFEICQSTVHGYGPQTGGYRICKKPCFCGKEFYPEGYKDAVELRPHEHQQSHPLWRPRTPTEPDPMIDESLTESSFAAQSPSTPLRDGSGTGSTTHQRTSSGSTDELALSPLVGAFRGLHIETDQSASSAGKSSVGEWSGWYVKGNLLENWRYNTAYPDGIEYMHTQKETAQSQELEGGEVDELAGGTPSGSGHDWCPWYKKDGRWECYRSNPDFPDGREFTRRPMDGDGDGDGEREDIGEGSSKKAGKGAKSKGRGKDKGKGKGKEREKDKLDGKGQGRQEDKGKGKDKFK
ncbi:uncharacterized protein BP5553_01133 [Venustampulla echinocandica]|uniref:Uncharacterized protein n=1 Tax=Venustampulla echinocandica TaxID=2656787 RepID=A0A370U066_9HELO|nr:uncharacterized protein BP5553_01133 [Venustampulla echinocandica]RDL41154.1 hypothetical protein BP5553_01133 [Venustampulla echinocandica]